MSEAVIVRLATVADLAALPAIEVAAGQLFREIGMHEIADDAPPTVAELATAASVWVAVEGGEVVGYARAGLVDGHAHLDQLSVLPACGGQGIGTALLDAVVDWARGRGDHAVTLTTFRDVAFNAPLYAKRGFDVVPEGAWSPGLRALVEDEAALGLDRTARVVMRRPTGGPADQ